MLLRGVYVGLTIVFWAFNSISGQEAADLILHKGTILTIDDKFATGELIAIKDGRIQHVGANRDLDQFKGDQTRIIDLGGRTVMPGFVEAHTHPLLSASIYEWVDVSGMTHRNARSALKALKEAVKKTPKGKWILAFGWDFMLMKDAMPLYRDFLDKEISSEHPIWVMMQSQHTHYFNSKAFELAGIDEHTPDPPGGGSYVKDKDGQLTGIVTESAPTAPFVAILPQQARLDIKRQIQKMYTRYNSKGITTIGAPGLFEDIYPGANAIEICSELSRDFPVQIRLLYYEVGKPSLVDSMPLTQDWYLRKIGQKYWIDGSPYTGSMLLRKAYLESSLNQKKLGISKGSFGHSMFPVPAYQNLFLQSRNLGWQIAVHAQGDSAVGVALSSFESVLSAFPKIDHRFRLEHLALITEDQLKTMSRLGLTPSFHINHIYYYGDSLKSSIVGRQRAERMMPVRKALEAGLKVSLHSDSPMYPPDPLLLVRTAVTRKTRSNQVIGSDQRIDLKEALRAITIYPAWQMHADNEIGSLEVGKRADFVILEQNPMKVNIDNIHRIRITATFVSGEKVY